jgi:hypothetical protein
MEEYEIACVKQDFFGNITHVEINERLLRFETIVHWLRTKKYNFYTFKGEHKTYVYPKRNWLSGWFLTTDLHRGQANNLEFLCNC